jgi:hypothetical protein
MRHLGLVVAVCLAATAAVAQDARRGGGGGHVGIGRGGTTETASTEDAVLVGSGTMDWQPKVIPDCDTASSALAYDVTTNAFSCNSISASIGSTIAMTGTATTNTITSDTTAATATTSVAALTIAPTAALGANDLILGVKDVVGGSTVFSVDLEGDMVANNLLPPVDLSNYAIGSSSLTWSNIYVQNLFSEGGDGSFNSANNQPTAIKGDSSSSGTAIAVRIGNNNTLSNSGDRIAQICNGSVSSSGCTGEVANIYQNGFYVQPAQTLTIADNGGGTNASSTLTPSSNLVRCTCNDANACDVTMGETGVQDGTHVRIISVTATACNFADSAGVSELGGAFVAGQYDSIEMVYSSDRWVEVGRSNN